MCEALLMEIEQEYELGDNIKAEVLELMLSKNPAVSAYGNCRLR